MLSVVAGQAHNSLRAYTQPLRPRLHCYCCGSTKPSAILQSHQSSTGLEPFLKIFSACLIKIKGHDFRTVQSLMSWLTCANAIKMHKLGYLKCTFKTPGQSHAAYTREPDML